MLGLHVIPLGVPGEWVWQRHVWPTDWLEAVAQFAPAVVAGTALFALAVVGSRRVSLTRRSGSGGALLALSVFSWGWLVAVQQAAPPAHRLAKPYVVLYDPSSSGYFFEAAFHIQSVPEFLRGYEARMQQGDVLHVGTHPPGLFLLNYGAIQLCDRFPGLVGFLNAVENPQVRQALRMLELSGVRSLEDHEIAALHLVSSLVTLAAAVVVVPLFLLLKPVVSPSTAWFTCCLWPTVPAIAVFAPKSDVFFTLTATTTLALAVISLRRRSLLAAIAAGVVLWAGLLMTLAHLPVAVVLVLFTAVRAFQFRDRRIAADLGLLAVCGGTVLTATLVWSISTDCNLLNVWQWNLHNHAGFYAQYSRTWWKWLLVNPLELCLAIGLPLASVAVAGGWSAFRGLQLKISETPKRSQSVPLVTAAAGTFLLLWLSGKNQGEAARLWCFLMPWALISAAPWLQSRVPDNGSLQHQPWPSAWRWLLGAQLICGLATVSRVSGFSF